MILIADSGSTKTDWRLIDGKKEIRQFRTSGLNPYFLSKEEMSDKIRQELAIDLNPEQVSSVFFYGAGCSSNEKCEVVAGAIKKVFPKATIEVHHDLLAACRASCGREEGIVGILGTGSNSCMYNGSEIISQVPSLGFILGDEGSGTHIGRKLLQGIFYRELPESIVNKFNDRFHLSKDDVLEAVYKKPVPNQFLASFTQFVFQNRSEAALGKMVYESFNEFFNRHICKYDGYRDLKIHTTGSVGFYFGDVFRQVAGEKGMRVGTITESPISGLTLYHINET